MERADMKMVIFLDLRTNEHVVFSHNLSPQDAEAEAAMLRKMELPAVVIDQTQPHPISPCEHCVEEIARRFNADTSPSEKDETDADPNDDDL
jgi:hypothetical protein